MAQDAPLRIFLRGGPKTHGPGQHDHPRFVEDWKTVLANRGAVADGALRFPTAAELERTDVLVLFAAEGATIEGDERARLDVFLKRGGGIVAIHDAVCGTSPQWFKTVAGGAWEHGHSKWLEGEVDLYIKDREHPITRGAENFRFKDEIYYDLHLDPAARVLAAGFHTPFDITPQMWVYEKDNYRAFVSIQGHEFESFSHPAWRTLLLRGIAWAGKRDVGLLLKTGEAEALAYPPGGPTAPSEAAAKIVVHPDFNISLVAAEPLIAKPISIDWDAKKRMWVALTFGYPEKEKFSKIPPRDEIAILQDSKGDGAMDKKIIFYKGLDLVTSLVHYKDGVIVTASPDIYFLRDTDGDDVCDKKETLFTGFGYGDTHAVVSNMRWGMDGWIYATQGYSGGASDHIKNAAGHDFGRIGNGLFRFKPDGSAIKMVSSYGSNTWGCDFDDDGELFFTMANGAHIRHVVMNDKDLDAARMPGLESWTDIADHDRIVTLIPHTDAPYAQIDFVGGFTAAAGCTIYNGGAWPAEWNHSHFVTEPTVHIVHHDVLAPKGVTYSATKPREAEFIAGRDLWFRPVHSRVGPDGALYILDFYNQAVVHNDTRGPQHGPTNAAVRPDRDHTHGRIWRVQHKNATALPEVSLSNANMTELAAALEHPNGWVRGTAQRLIIEQRDSRIVDSLQKIARESRHSYARILSAWTIADLRGPMFGKNEIALFEHLIEDAEPGVRTAALQISRMANTSTAKEPLAGAVYALIDDKNPRVRFMAYEALATLGFPSSAQNEYYNKLANGWKNSEDVYLRSAILRIGTNELMSFIATIQETEDFNPPMDLVTASVRNWMQRTRREGDVASTMVRLIGSRPLAKTNYIRAILDTTEKEARADVHADPKHWPAQIVGKLLSNPDPLITGPVLSLLGRYNLVDDFANDVENAATRLMESLRNEKTPEAARVRAFSILVNITLHRDAAIESAATLLSASSKPESQLAVLEQIARGGYESAGGILCDAVVSLTGAVRDRAFDILVERKIWSLQMIERIENGDVAPAALGPHKIHKLRSNPDAAVAARAVSAFEKIMGPENRKVDETVARILPEVDRPGDAANGKLVFTKNCAVCHTAFGEGGKVGPEISGIGTHGARTLLPTILDPNREVEPAYSEWIAWRRDGRSVAGVLVRESERSVMLRSSAGEFDIPRDELSDLKNTGRSPMPGGFEALGAANLRDLITYLSGGYSGFRVLNIRKVATSNTHAGLYDTKRDPKPMTFRKYGIVDLKGVPFEILDPVRSDSGNNCIVLKGGQVADWESKKLKPQKVEIAAGFPIVKVHVIGGIGAWAYPTSNAIKPILKWTWKYADGTTEETILKNGVEFADWIGHFDVPGSEYVDELLKSDSWGQVRRHAVAPKQQKVVDSIVLESYDNELAPTLIALTAELPGASAKPVATAPPPPPLDLFIFGGGSSHDFDHWFRDADLATLRAAGIVSSDYGDRPSELTPRLEQLKTLVLCANQPLADPAFRAGFQQFIARGAGLVILHPSNWYNWSDWPEFNKNLVGGGARGHEALGEFEVRVVKPDHPIAKDVPATFRITDELYQFNRDAAGAEIEVIAIGKSLKSGAEFPVVWTVARAVGRTACVTLGHDGSAHELPAFKTILTNAAKWAGNP